MKKIYSLLFTLTGLLTVNAQLQTGDIAFTGYNSDSPEGFSFITFVDIPAGTQINFTENGWQSNGEFRDNEGTAFWTSPGTVLPAGTQVLINDVNGNASTGIIFTDGNFFLSSGGDQIFAYDPNNTPGGGDETGFYAGIHMNGNWDTNSTSSTTSAQPASLVGFSIAINPEVDNAIYDCSTFEGTVDELRAAINNPDNWTTNNAILTLTQCNFTITTLSTQNFEKTTFSMYPNPTSNGFVNIKTSNNEATQVAVYDILGKQVINTTLSAQRLNVSSLKAGVYAVRLSQGNTVTTKKLVIK
ncbi:T9SS type A sorting domain-containing protein [Lacinutrix mariniflava]|uniref:T9SS type A sorting domain-containing protein n=1 Tax=Lacinutrix mariniflava TaxID=342955 RepID=UPI0006E3BFF2|nr:T9SS type A sorting domain-containing protein [Lacinutrix mariniflava]